MKKGPDVDAEQGPENERRSDEEPDPNRERRPDEEGQPD